MKKLKYQSLLSLSAIAMLGCAAIVSSSCAAESTANDNVTATINPTCSMSATVNSAHSTSIQGGNYSSNIGQTTFNIFCNYADGWKMVAVGYSDDTDGDTNMYNEGKAANIATGTATSGDNSAWAMKLGAVSGSYAPTIASGFLNYAQIPSEPTEVATGPKTDAGTGASGAQVTSTYQAYVSQYQASGNYTGKVKYTLYAVVPPQTLSTITNMQEATSEICANSALNETNQLKDTRDNKLYWVTKLADGNCWMTQNLDLGGSEPVALNSTNTDLADGNTFTLPASGSWSNVYNAAKIYDPGNKYLPNGTGSATDASSLTSDSEDLHWHQGNYYNWYAVTAGSNASTMSSGQEAPQSICPKGWRLPYGTTADKSWYKLINNGVTNITATTITQSPVFIPRASGYAGSLSNVGSVGDCWSSTAYGSSNAYRLYFNSSSVNPRNNDYAYVGYSARCLVR